MDVQAIIEIAVGPPLVVEASFLREAPPSTDMPGLLQVLVDLLDAPARLGFLFTEGCSRAQRSVQAPDRRSRHDRTVDSAHCVVAPRDAQADRSTGHALRRVADLDEPDSPSFDQLGSLRRRPDRFRRSPGHREQRPRLEPLLRATLDEVGHFHFQRPGVRQVVEHVAKPASRHVPELICIDGQHPARPPPVGLPRELGCRVGLQERPRPRRDVNASGTGKLAKDGPGPVCRSVVDHQELVYSCGQVVREIRPDDVRLVAHHHHGNDHRSTAG